MKYGRDIVATPRDYAANREHKQQPILQILHTTRQYFFALCFERRFD